VLDDAPSCHVCEFRAHNPLYQRKPEVNVFSNAATYKPVIIKFQ